MQWNIALHTMSCKKSHFRSAGVVIDCSCCISYRKTLEEECEAAASQCIESIFNEIWFLMKFENHCQMIKKKKGHPKHSGNTEWAKHRQEVRRVTEGSFSALHWQIKKQNKTTFVEQEAAGSGLQSRGLGFPSEGHLYLNNYLENSMLLEHFFLSKLFSFLRKKFHLMNISSLISDGSYEAMSQIDLFNFYLWNYYFFNLLLQSPLPLLLAPQGGRASFIAQAFNPRIREAKKQF